jgi:hypothetical protein
VSAATPGGRLVTTELEDSHGTFTLSEPNTIVTLGGPDCQRQRTRGFLRHDGRFLNLTASDAKYP